MRNNSRSKVRFGDLAALWIICWTFIPFMQIGNIYRIISFGCTGIWLLLHFNAVFSQHRNFVIIELFSIVARIFLLYMLSGSVSAAITNTIQYAIIVIVAMISFYYCDYHFDFFKRIFPFLLILIAVFSITTMKGIAENPYAARIANSEWLEDRFKGNEMVGLFGFVYMCVFLEPLLLYVILNKIKFGRWTDFLIKFTFICCFAMILTAGYMIAIFLLLAGCAIIWINYHNNPVKSFLVIILLVLFFLFYSTILDNIFSYLMNATVDNPVYYNKFHDFRMLLLSGSSSGETVFGRFKNYSASLKTVVDYPVIGSYFFGVPGGGGHSALLDVFGKFGWIVGSIFVYTYFTVPHRIGNGRQKWTILDYMMFTVAFVFSFADPAFQEMGVALFVVFPFIKRMSIEQLEERRIK